ncbi:MAG: SRPBCC family protein [Herpetosiphonaceae bacterium]|nr:SRPBCC family protein [Herpetosiphonaceae bacterium]
MSEYEESVSVHASSEDVFKFVSDIHNLPKYLPTIKGAEPEGGERVQVHGEARGHKYDNDGKFRVDHAQHRIEWSSDGENDYSGWLEVKGQGASSQVTVHLHFNPKPQQDRRLAEPTGSRDETMQEGLEAALKSIQNILEGHGGKEEPPAAS